MINDSLLNMTQGLMDSDFLQKLSGVLGQPIEKIQLGLKSVIPTFWMGVVNQGETPEGAQRLVSMAREQEIDPAQASNSFASEQYLRRGNEALNRIFGSRLSSIVNRLGTATGMNASSVVKMMGLVAPMVIGMLGVKIKSENLNATELKKFLSQQKSTLVGFVSVSGMSGQRRYWRMVVFAIMIIFFFFLWWRNDDREEDASLEKTSTTVPSAQTSFPVIDELNSFFESRAESELPKRFRFQKLMFETGSSLLVDKSDPELDLIADVLRSHPSASVRLEAFSENVGGGASNPALAERRAMAVKEELVARGVKERQIEAVGMGSTRSTSNRIEFVVTNF